MPEPAPSEPQRHVFHVSELLGDVRHLLERSFPLIWVQGEISNLARPGSGHWYLSLKDASGQVRCAMFRTRNRLVRFAPENGMQVLVRARVSLYEPRGDFQLIIEHMEEAGDGALQRAFDALKQRLDQEGLFDAARKRTLPPWPRRIGVITSPTGAAVRDILSVLKRRFPAIPVRIYPVPVQGAGAAQHIARAIALASRRRDCDVLILARGGGSLEDLWAFNEEVVARAVDACELPIVCGVGHEIDFSIADFVADQRAPTPSAAAEMVTPNGDECLESIARLEDRLVLQVQAALHRRRERLTGLERRIVHPARRLQTLVQRCDELEQRLHRAARVHLRHLQAQVQHLGARLARHTPLHRLNGLAQRRDHLERRLGAAQVRLLERRKQGVMGLIRALDAVSPLATLSRGYAIVTRADDGSVVHSSDQVTEGERVEARLGAGRLICSVEGKSSE